MLCAMVTSLVTFCLVLKWTLLIKFFNHNCQLFLSSKCAFASEVSSAPLVMDKELLCYICGNLFTNPVLLPCGHSLCLCCAESHYRYCKDDYSQQPCKWIGTSCENSGNYRVKCPLCNFDFTLPHGGVYGFVKNEIIEKIIEKSCKGIVYLLQLAL